MAGFVLGLLFGVSIAAGSLYVIYLWANAEQKKSSPPPAEKPAPVKEVAQDVAQPAPAAAPVATSRTPPRTTKAPAEPEAKPAHTEALWLGELSNRIEGEIGTHSFRIKEISDALSDAKEGGPDAVLDAASQIMLANQQLQAELAAARTEIDEHRKKVKELAAEARTDPLTGLANRRAFTEDMSRRIEQWRRHKVPLSLIMVDIDHFKSINDRYTHAGGDTALRHIGDLLRGALREMDIPVRYGGEEFAIILPGTRMQEALNVAERLRATIATRGFVFEGQMIPLTASLGLATATPDDSLASLVDRADTAL
jgi:diguanylate cyclase